MSTFRTITKILRSKPTMEGAGVRLKRVFGNNEVPLLDPFLLLDHFGSDNPDDYMAGFPWHPHRGIETVTYMLEGKVEHGDSIGNSGVIGSGDVQWMTAGGGIIHQEMPKRIEGMIQGFQLWVNLPASSKMMTPRYQEVKSDEIPIVELANGTKVKVICGEVNGVRGPVRDIMADPEYLDVTIPAGEEFEHKVNDGYLVFAYVMQGSGMFGASDQNTDSTSSGYAPTDRGSGGDAGTDVVTEEHLVIFGKEGSVKVNGGEGGIRFLLISGKPIGEPVAWYGPIVMNSKEDLETAFREYREGTFIRS